jgi:hypothetical protein
MVAGHHKAALNHVLCGPFHASRPKSGPMSVGYFREMRRKGRLALRLCGVRLLFALAALTLFSVPALAQVGSDTETAQAQAAILEAGTMAKLADMDFGVIAQPAAAGTVVLTPTPTATCATTGGLVRTGTCQAAEFAIMERRNGRARIRLLNGTTVTLTEPGGATMLLNNVTINVTDMTPIGGAPGWNLGHYQITSNSGIARFRLGGRLNVNAGQAHGTYTGTLNVQVNFN